MWVRGTNPKIGIRSAADCGQGLVLELRELQAPVLSSALRRNTLHRLRLDDAGRRLMYFVAVVLTVLSGLFYAAGHHEIGSFSTDVCRYGSTFCDNPAYILVGAVLAAIWGKFVSVR
jgi:hypothetical protein